MKNMIISLMIFSSTIPIFSNQEKSIIGNDSTGFFVNFCRVLNHLYHCKIHNKTPVVYWGSDSAYWSEDGYNDATNAWEYYFEPVSEEKYVPGDYVRRESYSDNFSVLWDYHQYISNMKYCSLEDRENFIRVTKGNLNCYWAAPTGGLHIYDQRFRKTVKNDLIDPYIKIKPSVTERVDSFFLENMEGKQVIGIHLRGRHIGNILPFVPIQTILEKANELGDDQTIFFIATDQFPLIEEARAVLKGRVIYCDIPRFETTTSPAGGPKLHPKLGEDLLVEALLLSKCDNLIHTISTVSTAVLYFNPTMKHVCLY
jgi:hypothetical protein